MDILVLDDEADICEILTCLFQDQGYSVMSANDADSAAAIVRSKKPKLLICDITMPGRNGIQLLEDLKREGAMVGVVMLTAHAESSMVIQALQLGALDYIVKPFDSDALMAKVSAWLEMGKRLQEISEQIDDNAAKVKQQLRMLELFRLKNKRNSDQVA